LLFNEMYVVVLEISIRKREVGEFIGNFGIRVRGWGLFPRKQRVSLNPYMVFQVVPRRGFPTSSKVNVNCSSTYGSSSLLADVLDRI
jgi:hypothetical protein